MQDKASCRLDHGCNPPSTDDEDAVAQAAVLAFVLEEHPALMTIPELVRAMCRRVGDFDESDDVERAIRDLVGLGLLRCEGASVLPTRAALHFDRLAGE